MSIFKYIYCLSDSPVFVITQSQYSLIVEQKDECRQDLTYIHAKCSLKEYAREVAVGNPFASKLLLLIDHPPNVTHLPLTRLNPVLTSYAT